MIQGNRKGESDRRGIGNPAAIRQGPTTTFGGTWRGLSAERKFSVGSGLSCRYGGSQPYESGKDRLIVRKRPLSAGKHVDSPQSKRSAMHELPFDIHSHEIAPSREKLAIDRSGPVEVARVLAAGEASNPGQAKPGAGE